MRACPVCDTTDSFHDNEKHMKNVPQGVLLESGWHWEEHKRIKEEYKRLKATRDAEKTSFDASLASVVDAVTPLVVAARAFSYDDSDAAHERLVEEVDKLPWAVLDFLGILDEESGDGA